MLVRGECSMERREQLWFQCMCGEEPFEVEPEKTRYTCPKCGAAWFLLAVPFNVFNGHERFLLNKKAPEIQAICSEIAAKRLLVFFRPNLISAVDINRYLQKRGCYDIHTICKCINYSLNMENAYQLFYRNPFVAYENFLMGELPFFFNYMKDLQEPIIVSTVPKGNWARFKALINEASPKPITEILREVLHTIMITGFRITNNPGDSILCIHNYISNTPIEEQKPFSLLDLDQFAYAHIWADFRTILNTERIASRPNLAAQLKKHFTPWTGSA
jgi:hypothetical protein